jgi:hypothetical protein
MAPEGTGTRIAAVVTGGLSATRFLFAETVPEATSRPTVIQPAVHTNYT